MYSDVDLNNITDGKLYKSSDLVKISCNGCIGCHECCCTVADTILLDPLDIYNLSKALKKNFAEMMENEIEIRLVDNIVIPNIMMQEGSSACGMLSKDGRCTIHPLRPGFCRLFPLGRLYDDSGDFNYIIQVHECSYPNKSDVKVQDWLGIKNLQKYEQFNKDWHRVIKNLTDYLAEYDNETVSKKLSWLPLRLFFEPPYDTTADFYEQFYARLEIMEQRLS
ncbi:MAG: YkgJ family cysteine cluster protein [Lachnospiraceae bacterium]|nr:YkgJ family cysteine cluster protein [Lachnospiraceae bacterium]